MNYRLQKFFSERMFLIDSYKLNETEYKFKLEDNCKNYYVNVKHGSIYCTCDFNMILCRHIKFVIKKILEVSGNIYNFNGNKNPKYKEYKEYEEYKGCVNDDINERCDICLENFTGKIIMCKTCKKYFHEKCIYEWLRTAICCNCPLCRSIWH